MKHITRYVIQRNTLCEDPTFQYNPTAMVHIVIPVHNQGGWIRHLLENLEAVYHATRDENFSLILVDYSSDDTDLQAAMENFDIPHKRLITLPPPFSRASGVQAGIDAVTNPDDIILTCDLHLEIPPGLLLEVRRHTIKGRTGYNPVLIRLDCNADPDKPTVRERSSGRRGKR